MVLLCPWYSDTLSCVKSESINLEVAIMNNFYGPNDHELTNDEETVEILEILEECEIEDDSDLYSSEYYFEE